MLKNKCKAKRDKNIQGEIKAAKPKRKIKWTVFFAGILFFAAAGYLLASTGILDNADKATDESDPLAAGVNAVRLQKTTVIQWEYHYESCGHSIYNTENIPSDWVGLSKEEFIKKIPNTKIINFSSGLVSLKNNFRCYCENHYILIEENGELNVYSTSSGSDEQTLNMTFKPISGEMTKEEKESLKEGKVFSNMNDLIAYIDTGNFDTSVESGPE